VNRVWRDLRHGARLLLRAPGFAAVAVCALAIGIGANTAIFSVVYTLLIKPLPYQDPERLVVVWEHNIPRDRKNNVVSPGNFLHWREMQQSFGDLAAVGMTLTVTLTGAGEPEKIPMQLVSASFFPLLGVQPALGRVFTAEEDRPRSRVVVISDRLWKRRFDGDPNILSRPVNIDGVAYSVVGVMPAGFSYLDRTAEMWFPVGFSAEARTPRGRWITVLGKMKPGVTVEAAQADMTRVHAELTRMFPEFNTGWTARVVPLRQQLTGDVRPALFILSAAVGLLLLIACANVANLLLARATTRQRELAVRAALGAGRGRLIRQLIAESLILSAASAFVGLLLAWWGIGLLRAVVAERLPIQRLEIVAIDPPVLAFTIAVTLFCALLFGLVPALTAAGGSLVPALKEGGRSGSGAHGGRTRRAFVVVEVALALVLLAGAGLLVRSFSNLLDVNAGFDPSRIVTMTVSLPGSRYGEAHQRTQFFQRLFDRLEVLPGVEAAGGTSFLPLVGLGAATSYEVVGQPNPPRGQDHVADVRVVANDYFKAMGIPLMKGRLFDESDKGDVTNWVIINETMARKHWPGQDPLGKKVRINWNDDREDEVIGVVGDVRHLGLDTEPRAMTYWPHPRFPYSGMTITIRTAGDASTVVRAATAAIRAEDPDLAVADVRTMNDVVSRSVAERRLLVELIGLFAIVALVLAAVGIYGVIAYMVTQRTQEIGIRMALGARQGRVLRMIVGEAMALTTVGAAVGIAGALALTRLMKDLLFQVPPRDPVTLAAVTATLIVVAFAASYLPGRRATRIDPAIALRAE
jgi:putative ABC transport system permease protein